MFSCLWLGMLYFQAAKFQDKQGIPLGSIEVDPFWEATWTFIHKYGCTMVCK